MKPMLTLLTRRNWIGHLLAVAGGISLTLSLAPFDIWPLSLLAIVLYAMSLQLSDQRQAILRGWFFGAGLFGSGASWVYVSIHLHGHAPLPLAVALTALFCGGLALCVSLTSYLYVRFFRDHPAGLLLALPALWVLGEWFRIWFLTGFPWLFLGYSQVDGMLAGWAPVIGTLGISWLIASTACAATWLLLNWQQSTVKNRLLLSGLLISVWLVSPLLQTIDWVQPKMTAIDNGRLRVATVQANIPQEDKWRPEHLGPSLKLYREMTEQLWDFDLIIWPETAIPRLYHKARGFISLMDKAAKTNKSAIMSGIPYKEPESGQYYNSMIAFGDAEGIYHKQRLVPFGEYIPLENYLRGLIEFFDLPMSNFSIGPDSNHPIRVKGFELAPFICYEIVYPDLVAATIPTADFLLTISNDTWFGRSHGPVQHFQMARMRALENGRQLIRATNNGISALVDEKGRVIKQAESFTRTTLQGTVQAMTGLTPFSRWGSFPVIAAAFLVLLTLLILQGRQARE